MKVTFLKSLLQKGTSCLGHISIHTLILSQVSFYITFFFEAMDILTYGVILTNDGHPMHQHGVTNSDQRQVIKYVNWCICNNATSEATHRTVSNIRMLGSFWPFDSFVLDITLCSQQLFGSYLTFLLLQNLVTQHLLVQCHTKTKKAAALWGYVFIKEDRTDLVRVLKSCLSSCRFTLGECLHPERCGEKRALTWSRHYLRKRTTSQFISVLTPLCLCRTRANAGLGILTIRMDKHLRLCE